MAKTNTCIFLIALFLCLSALNSYSQTENERQQIISKDLDDWERALANHHQMASVKTWDDANQRHQTMEDEMFQTDDLEPAPERARENINPKATKTHQLSLSGEFFYAHYEEPDVMEQRGTLWGTKAAYTYRPNRENLLYNPLINTFRAEAMFATGTFDYEAEASAQTGLQVTNKENFLYELRALIGKEYIYRNLNSLLIYGGFGYRYLNDDDDGTLVFVGNAGFYGYERESNYYYLPLGFELGLASKNTWRLTFKGEYDFFIKGVQESHLSDGNVFLSSPNGDLTNEQKHGYGVRGSIELAKDFPHISVFAEPYFRFWHIEDSEIESVIIQGTPEFGLEPENRTIEGGIRAGVQF